MLDFKQFKSKHNECSLGVDCYYCVALHLKDGKDLILFLWQSGEDDLDPRRKLVAQPVHLVRVVGRVELV